MSLSRESETHDGAMDPESVDRVQQDRADSPVPSCLSMKSDESINLPVNFPGGTVPINPSDQQERSDQSHQMDLSSVFKSLEINAMKFLKDELENIERKL